jgi:hypothetical protein
MRSAFRIVFVEVSLVLTEEELAGYDLARADDDKDC